MSRLDLWVNAGPASMYTLGKLQTTRYLQEFKAGDEVIIVNREGKTRKTNVGQIKIEIRPLILVEAQVEGTNDKNYTAKRRNHPSSHAERLKTRHRTKTQR